MHSFPGSLDNLLYLLYKPVADGAVKGEGENQPFQIRLCYLLHCRQPNLFPQFNEWLAAIFKERQYQIDRKVVVEETIPGNVCQRSANSQFSYTAQSCQNDQIHL